MQMVTRLVPFPIVGAAHCLAHHSRRERQARPVECSVSDWRKIDDEMGTMPKEMRLLGRLGSSVGLACAFGPAALLAIPAYDAAKAAFHVSIGREDKAVRDGVSAVIGTVTAGVSCGAEAVAHDAVIQCAAENITASAAQQQICDCRHGYDCSDSSRFDLGSCSTKDGFPGVTCRDTLFHKQGRNDPLRLL